MESITFCIATAKNEKEYVNLLLHSLKDNTNISQHEILVFIDSDNQDTYASLLDLKNLFPNLKTCYNPNLHPIGGQRNISLMFHQAKNNIVCYLQSDMVIGKDFDKHILKNIDQQTVLSCTRIEPPLHPESPEKIVKDFGITPETFQYDNFNKFVSELQKENRPNIVSYFAPFAIYKNTWFDKLGGFDTQFRCSREDSDLIIRIGLAGLNMIQCWNACVYHFTCVSSRGKDWFKSDKETKYKNELQSLADQQELKRFIRKWGFFGHHPKPVYDITFDIEIDRYIDFNILKYIEPFCKKLNLSNPNITNQLINQIEFDSYYYANLRWGYPYEYWEKVKHLFNPFNFKEKITSDKNINNDIIVSFKYSELIDQFTEEIRHLLENIHSVVDQNEIGMFTYGPLNIHIKEKNNLMNNYKKANNIELILKDQEFKFI